MDSGTNHHQHRRQVFVIHPFFRLTNSPATFQAMINELLRDLINTRKVAAFIDDVIVGMETEEGHDKLVAEVIRRLEENNLYVKLEKYR